jgi:MerR family transcriptional regulator, redox-sensitive transcriptional activator SoxR
MSSATFSIGELAARTGKPATAIRYYEQIGLLPAPERAGGRRVYGDADVRRVRLVDAAQRGGFALEEIRQLLEGARLRDLARLKLPEVDAVLDQTQKVRVWLEHASGCECEPVADCPLLAG